MRFQFCSSANNSLPPFGFGGKLAKNRSGEILQHVSRPRGNLGRLPDFLGIPPSWKAIILRGKAVFCRLAKIPEKLLGKL
jgi:hypothetical protein